MEINNRENTLENITIIGLGMIGGSIAKDIRNRFPDSTISAIDSSETTIVRAIEENVIDNAIGFEDISDIARFVIIAAPIDAVIPIANRITEATKDKSDDVIVIDVASVKNKIVNAFFGLTNSTVEFIGTHPMAGTEFAGLAHAKKDLFQAKPWMICSHEKNTEEGLKVVKRFISTMGGRIREMDAREHDNKVAVVSHSIIMLSNYIFDFVASEYNDSLEFAGDGFTSTTRLASGNPELHSQIIASNKEPTREQLVKFNNYLSRMVDKGIVVDEDFFLKNAERRNHWLHKRK